MILDTDEQALKRPFDRPISYDLLKELGCERLDSYKSIAKITDLRILYRISKLITPGITPNHKYIEYLELKLRQIEDKQYPDLWIFNYKGHEILFNSSYNKEYDDFTGYEIGTFVTVVLYAENPIYIRSVNDFLDSLDKVVEYNKRLMDDIKHEFIIIDKDTKDGKTYQQSVQRNLLRKQRLPKFQKSIRCYRSPRMFRNRNR